MTCTRNDHCLTCSQSHYGDLCESTCDNCPGLICKKDGECEDHDTQCNDKIHTGDYCTTLCSENHPNCVQCLRTGICTTCFENKYKEDYCTEECSKCPGEVCHKNGTCLDLGENCYQNLTYGEDCESKCGSKTPECEACERNGDCLYCKDQKNYGINCENSCSKCPDGICYMNSECINDGNCAENNTYGPSCNIECSEISPLCNKCSREGKCLYCSDMKTFGDKCQSTCKNCPKETCYMDGNCTDSQTDCNDNHFFGSDCKTPCTDINENCDTCNREGKCTKCISEYYFGDFCLSTCDNCPGKQCNMNGTCVDQSQPCIDDTFYGESCNKSCDETKPFCKTCDRQGKCSNCTDKSHFGDNCDKTCNNCPNKKCHMDGICDDYTSDCEDQQNYGSFCNDSCTNIGINKCVKCHRNEECITCLTPYYYGNKCEKTCDWCPQKECRINGECVYDKEDCLDGKTFGDDCQIPCSNISSNCELCHRNQICYQCENRTSFGPYCNDSCLNCPGIPGYCNNSGVCDDLINPCDDDTFTGSGCSQLCSKEKSNCKRCDRNNKCRQCIDEEFFGPDCTYSCEVCPGNTGCDIEGVCFDNHTNCDDDTFTGDMCNTLCNVTYDNCFRCNRSNLCHECINKEFYGPFCNYSCKNCPGECDINGICVNNTNNCDDDTFT